MLVVTTIFGGYEWNIFKSITFGKLTLTWRKPSRRSTIGKPERWK